MKVLSVALLWLSLWCSGAAFAESALETALEELRHRWAVANYEMRGKPRITALQTLLQEADRLTAANPERAEPWIWSGIIHFTMASAESGLRALIAARAARADLERAVNLDPQALGAAAYTYLGALYYKIPGWPMGFGDRDRAEQLLKRALEINPESMDANYFYGDFLLEQGHRRRALGHLLRAQQAPPRPGRPLADSGRQREIAKLLKRADAS